jgi:putative sterol carrier protein
VSTVQYRVAFGKKDEVVEGPDDATVVVSVAAADSEMDPTVAFMRGRLKASGSTGELLRLLQSGEMAPVLSRLGKR